MIEVQGCLSDTPTPYTGESGASCTHLRKAHNHQQISNFRELLPYVTLWIAALYRGDVGKILTHPHPLSRDVSSRVKGTGGGVKC